MYRVAKEFAVEEVMLTKEIEQRIATLTAANKCLACECVHEPGTQVICGTCPSCNQTQHYGMRKGKCTLRQLIQRGERLPAKPGGRKPGTKYAAQLLGRDGEVG
jgi:hypothetical protein